MASNLRWILRGRLLPSHFRGSNSHLRSPLKLLSVRHGSSEDQGICNPLASDDYFGVKKMVTLPDLFNARVHLGHQEGCWNRKMKPFIYGTRAHSHIIDLNITLRNLQVALNVVSNIAYRNGIILFVSTHPRFEYLIQKTAREAKEFFVTRQWYDGTLTNMVKVFPRVNPRQPDLIIFMNTTFLGSRQWAVIESAMANIPSIGILDTDCDPSHIMYPIPGNDDSPCAMELYCELFKQAILNAKERRQLDDSQATENERESCDSVSYASRS